MVSQVAPALSNSRSKTTPAVPWASRLESRLWLNCDFRAIGEITTRLFGISGISEKCVSDPTVDQGCEREERTTTERLLRQTTASYLMCVASVLPMRYDESGIDGELGQGTGRGWSRWHAIPTDLRSMAHLNSSLAFLMRPVLVLLVYVNVSIALLAMKTILERDFQDWTLAEAVEILNQSSWAQQRTFTRVVAGIGSGVLGEKEIFKTFFVRFLSAEPIRKAFVRVQQIQQGYEQMSEDERKDFEALVSPGLKLDVSQWIVVSLTFRSNNPRQERRVESFLDAQTVETMKARAFLSTDRLSQVELEAYFPPRRDGVGAKFVFPRQLSGEPIITKEESSVTFEANLLTQRLRVTFLVSEMLLDGELAL